jgi:hypothetical protein
LKDFSNELDEREEKLNTLIIQEFISYRNVMFLFFKKKFDRLKWLELCGLTMKHLPHAIFDFQLKQEELEKIMSIGKYIHHKILWKYSKRSKHYDREK